MVGNETGGFMRTYSLLGILIFGHYAVAEEKSPVVLPVAWHGAWHGKLLMTGAADRTTEVAIVLDIAPIKGSRDYTWKVTYGEGEKKAVKDYKLVPDPAGRPGRFQTDEQNGVVLDCRLVGNVLYSHFEVMGIVLTARNELRGDIMHFEVTSARAAATKTGDGKEQGYPVDAVQTAELKKK